MKLRTEDS